MPTFTAHAPDEGPPYSADDHSSPRARDPSGQRPQGYYREAFFGTLAPIDMGIEWNGHHNTVSLRILEADEARRCAHFAYVRSEGHVESEEYLLAETIARIAFMLEAVDGRPITDECRTLDERLQLAAELPDTLQDAIIEAYNEARLLPLQFLGEMQRDPNTDGTPTDTGSASAGVPASSLPED